MSTGSLGCLTHAKRASSHMYSSFPFPAAAAPLNSTDVPGLAINSSSAPLIRRTAPHRSSNMTALHFNQPR